eukprot:3765259-Rhodomonas_salina.1
MGRIALTILTCWMMVPSAEGFAGTLQLGTRGFAVSPLQLGSRRALCARDAVPGKANILRGMKMGQEKEQARF